MEGKQASHVRHVRRRSVVVVVVVGFYFYVIPNIYCHNFPNLGEYSMVIDANDYFVCKLFTLVNPFYWQASVDC